MFNVTFYTITKQHNSTALPTGAGSTFSCTAKEPLSIMSPQLVIRLSAGAAGNPYQFNYCYIASFARYYWINDWINDGPNWTCTCQVDVLASFRTDIMSYYPYVLRASAEYDGTIRDNMYPAKNKKSTRLISLTDRWTGIPDWFDFNNQVYKGCFVVGIASMGFVQYYVFNAEGLYQFVYYLVSDNYATAVLGALTIALYPEAKIAVNPMQYITSIMYIPNMDLYNNGTAVNSINVGPVSCSVLYCKSVPNQLARLTYTETVSLITYKHPDAASRGAYLNAEPWTTYELYYPPFGLIKLDSSYLAVSNTLSLEMVIDGRTGDAVLKIGAIIPDADTPSAGRTVKIAEVPGFVGVQIPISSMTVRQTGGLSTLSQIFSGAMSAVSGNAVGLVNSVESAIGDAAEAMTPHYAVIGSAGSAASLSGSPQLIITYTEQAEELNRDLGKPLCQTKNLSTLSPGFIMCLNADLAISGTREEQEQLNAFLNGGMHLA